MWASSAWRPEPAGGSRRFSFTEPAELGEETALHAPIPAQRDTDNQDPAPSQAPSADAVRQAVREALAEELVPILAQLTAPASNSDGPASGRQDAPDRLREAAEEIKEELGAVLGEARSGLASLQQEITALRATVEELQPRPDAASETAAAEVSEEHSNLLKTAARVSSAGLLCHRDIWEFITAQAGRHPHFRVPPQVADEGDERVRAALSGRSLIALLISLHSVKHTADDGDGDRELAATLYERIEESLAGLTSSGEPVTITLDDRSISDANALTAENGAVAGSEPGKPCTPPASTEQDTGPDEEAGPTTV
ncbi:hypothetical protein RKD29_007943 [Streptomyces tendae]|uniref:hypothetical protein n=1 Tax=Streptomyces tendae TaxID=1932 RepID=UPI0038352153